MNKFYLKEVDSTNKYTKENIDKFVNETIIYTDRQTAGRGRFERKWLDLGSRNLYMTIVLPLSGKFKPAYSNLTQYLALKTCKTLETYGVAPKIKWPNDNLVNNKKISGILSEAVFSKTCLKGILLGIGVNLNATPEEIKAIPNRTATALNLETGHDINRDKFLDKLCRTFFEDYEKFIEQGFSLIRDEYMQYLVLLGEKITLTHVQDTLEGIFDTVNEDGTIRLITSEGIKNLSVGDILNPND